MLLCGVCDLAFVRVMAPYRYPCPGCGSYRVKPLFEVEGPPLDRVSPLEFEKLMQKDKAIHKAKRLTHRTGREHVVRNRSLSSCPEYIVTPLYEVGLEGDRYDAAQANLGSLVWRKE